MTTIAIAKVGRALHLLRANQEKKQRILKAITLLEALVKVQYNYRNIGKLVIGQHQIYIFID